MAPQLISGNINKLDPDELRATLKDAGITRLDTAAKYVNGESEKTLGRARFPDTFQVDTKILTNLPSEGTLTPENIEKSLSNSLTVLGVEKVNVLYCHAPDFTTPVAKQARAFNEHYKKGRFTYLGVSNFPTPMVEEWLSIAEKENLVKPAVYEGQYNLLCRGYETELFPLLHKHDISFVAYSPLAGGFLLGNFTADGVQGGSRFAGEGLFKTWYDRPSMHEAIKRFRAISEKAGLGMDELSLRWLAHHSILQQQDGIILGASKVAQISKNVAQIRNGPLDEEIAKELSELWESVKEDGMKIIDFSSPKA